MQRSETHWTLSSSIIFLATVVLPEALPPQRPTTDPNELSPYFAKSQRKLPPLTNNERFLHLTTAVVPWWSTGRVNGLGAFDMDIHFLLSRVRLHSLERVAVCLVAISVDKLVKQFVSTAATGPKEATNQRPKAQKKIHFVKLEKFYSASVESIWKQRPANP